MIRRVGVLAAALIAAGATLSAAAQRPTPRELEEQIVGAERTADIAVFRRLLSDHIVVIGPDGERHTKPEMLEILQSIPPHQVEASDFVSLPAGRDAMIVNYVVTQPTPDGAKRHTASSVWLKTHTGWSMIFHQGTSIPSTRSSTTAR